MPLPLDTNTLPSDLAARFLALRTPTSQSSTSIHNADETLEERLKRLEPPTDKEVEVGVPIEVNSEGDEAVARFLSLSQSSPPLSDPLSSPLLQRLPELSRSPLDHLSGVEIQFMRPWLGASTGEDSSFPLANEEEDELIKRMRDELRVEESTQKRSEVGVEEWEKRLEGLRGVVGGRPRKWEEDERVSKSLGEAPELGELERELEKRRRKKREKKEDESEETEESEDETETESEKDSEDDEER